jgi:hypothetical protein
MLGITVPDIHRALDKAAQASMTPQALSSMLRGLSNTSKP